jgi:hypothetical protein
MFQAERGGGGPLVEACGDWTVEFSLSTVPIGVDCALPLTPFQ